MTEKQRTRENWTDYRREERGDREHEIRLREKDRISVGILMHIQVFLSDLHHIIKDRIFILDLPRCLRR